MEADCSRIFVNDDSLFYFLSQIQTTRCERGEECLDYDLEKKKSDYLHSRPKYGVAFCNRCLEYTTLCMNNRRMDTEGFLNHEFLSVSKDYRETKFIVRRPLFEKSTNDPVGPLP